MDSVSSEELGPIRPSRLRSKPIQVTKAPKQLPSSIRPSHHWFRKLLATVFRARRMDTPLRLWKSHFERFKRDFDEALKEIEHFMASAGEELTDEAVELLALREDFSKLNLRSENPIETAQALMQRLEDICEQAEVERPSLADSRNHIDQLTDIELELARRSSQAHLSLRSDAETVSQRLIRNQQFDRAAVLRSAIGALDAAEQALDADVSFERLKEIVAADRQQRSSMDRTLRNQQKRLHQQPKTSGELLELLGKLESAKPRDRDLVIRCRTAIVNTILNEHKVMTRGRQIATIANDHYNSEVRDGARGPSDEWSEHALLLYALLDEMSEGNILQTPEDFRRNVSQAREGLLALAPELDRLIQSHERNSADTKLANIPQDAANQFTQVAEREKSWQRSLCHDFMQEVQDTQSSLVRLRSTLVQNLEDLQAQRGELEALKESNGVPTSADLHLANLQSRIEHIQQSLASIEQWSTELTDQFPNATSEFNEIGRLLDEGREGLEAYRQQLGPFRKRLSDSRDRLRELDGLITREKSLAQASYGDREDGIKLLHEINRSKRKGRQKVDELAARLLDNADRCQKRELYIQAFALRRLALELSAQVERAHVMAGLAPGRIPLDTAEDPQLAQRVTALNQELAGIVSEIETRSTEAYSSARDWEGQYKALLQAKERALQDAQLVREDLQQWAQEGHQPLASAIEGHAVLLSNNIADEANLFLNALKPKLIAEAQANFIDDIRMLERRRLRAAGPAEERALDREIDMHFARIQDAAMLQEADPSTFLDDLDRLNYFPVDENAQLAIPIDEADTVLMNEEEWDLDAFVGLRPQVVQRREEPPQPLEEEMELLHEEAPRVVSRQERVRRLFSRRQQASQKAAIKRVEDGLKAAKREQKPMLDGYEEMLYTSIDNVTRWASRGSAEEKQRSGAVAAYLQQQLGAEIGLIASMKQELQAANTTNGLQALRQRIVAHEGRIKAIKHRIGRFMDSVDVARVQWVQSADQVISPLHRLLPVWNDLIQEQMDLGAGGATRMTTKITQARQQIESPMSAQHEVEEANEAAVDGILIGVREHQAALALQAEELAIAGNLASSREVDAEATRLADLMYRVEGGARPPSELRDLNRQAQQLVKRSEKLLPRAAELPVEQLERSHLERLQHRMDRYLELVPELSEDAAHRRDAFLYAAGEGQLNNARVLMQQFEDLIRADLEQLAAQQQLRDVDLPEIKSWLEHALGELGPEGVVSQRRDAALRDVERLNQLSSLKHAALDVLSNGRLWTESEKTLLRQRSAQAYADMNKSAELAQLLAEVTETLNADIGQRLQNAIEQSERLQRPDDLAQLKQDYMQALQVIRQAEDWLDQNYVTDDLHNWRSANKELGQESALSKKTHDSTLRVYQSFAAEGRSQEALATLALLQDYEFNVNLAFAAAGVPPGGQIPEEARPDPNLAEAVHIVRENRLAARQALLAARKALENPPAPKLQSLQAKAEDRAEQLLKSALQIAQDIGLREEFVEPLSIHEALMTVARLRHEPPANLDNDLLDLVYIHLVAAAEADSLARRIRHQANLEQEMARLPAVTAAVQRLEENAALRREAIQKGNFQQVLIYDQRRDNIEANWDDTQRLLQVATAPERSLKPDERAHADESPAAWRAARPDLCNSDLERVVDYMYSAHAQMKELDLLAKRRKVEAEQAIETLELDLRAAQEQAELLKSRPGAELMAERRELLFRARRVGEQIEKLQERIRICEQARLDCVPAEYEELFGKIVTYDLGYFDQPEQANFNAFKMGQTLLGLELLEDMESVLNQISAYRKALQ